MCPRTDSVGIFPNRDTIIRLIGEVLAEQIDVYTERRRYLGLDSLARCRVLHIADTGSEVDTETITAFSAQTGGSAFTHSVGRDPALG